MDLIETIVLVSHVLFAAAVTGLVLIQHGKGADVGASFGAGASQTVFGAKGSGSFLTRMTSGLAVAFFITSFALAVFAKQRASRVEDVGIPVPAAVESRAQTGLDASTDTVPAQSLPQGEQSELYPEVTPSESETQPELE
jgi:preprotein translocase subunit SecG